MERHEIGKECSTNGREDKCIHCLEKLYIGVMIILKKVSIGMRC
jgi:hypothetical protein